MSIDERELRSRLAQTAALAGPPRFTAEDLAVRVRRIRRRRRGHAGIIAISAAVVAAAITIPLTRGGTGQPVTSAPGHPGPEPSYAVTVNGQTRTLPATGGPPPLFTVIPGEKVTMTVEVTVPGRPWVMTALWLGITNGMLSPRPAGPAGMNPILAASTRVPLRPGAHRFVLHWTVPAGLRPGTSRQLSAEWIWSGPGSDVAEGEIAEFAVPLPSGAMSSAAAELRLRTMARHAVASCDGVRPAWILAVRTTFGKAMAVVGGGNDIADNAGDAVYLVLMKGEFTFAAGGPSPCGRAPAGRYYSAVIDAVTFVTLEAGLSNRWPLRACCYRSGSAAAARSRATDPAATRA